MKIEKKSIDKNFIKKWMNKGLNPILTSILYRRGFSTDEELINMIEPHFENIPSPFIFSNLDKVCTRLDKAISNKEKIIIFGDKDVDGTTSTAILYNFLKSIDKNLDIMWYVPLKNEFYGLNSEKFGEWEKHKITLCIALDCGITNTYEVKTLKKIGIDSIIIDHHKPLDNIPNEALIINPKCENIEFSDIPACGVTFLVILGFLIFKSEFYNKSIALIYDSNDKKKIEVDIYINLLLKKSLEFETIDEINNLNFDLYFSYSKNIIQNKKLSKDVIQLNDLYINGSFIKAIDSTKLMARMSLFNYIFLHIKNLEKTKEDFLPLVALGVIADIMPIVSVNRIFTKFGFQYLKQKKLSNILALADKILLDLEFIDSDDISWSINPILNSSGRLGEANITVKFLLNDNESVNFINNLISNNKERKLKGDEAFNFFKPSIENNISEYGGALTFFYSDKIYKGITGVTANRIAKETNIPSIVAVVEGDYVVGSIRASSELDTHVVEFLELADNIFSEFGGHRKAAGFRFHKKNMENFINFLKVNSSILKRASSDSFSIDIDAEIPLKYLDTNLFALISILEPFGEDNKKPIFLTKDIDIASYNRIGTATDKKHLKLFISLENGKQLAAIFWNKANEFEKIHKEENLYDIIYEMEINKYNNQFIPQLKILEIIFNGGNI